MSGASNRHGLAHNPHDFLACSALQAFFYPAALGAASRPMLL